MAFYQSINEMVHTGDSIGSYHKLQVYDMAY